MDMMSVSLRIRKGGILWPSESATSTQPRKCTAGLQSKGPSAREPVPGMGEDSPLLGHRLVSCITGHL